MGSSNSALLDRNTRVGSNEKNEEVQQVPAEYNQEQTQKGT